MGFFCSTSASLVNEELSNELDFYTSNGTGNNPTLTSSFSLSNPGNFAVSGTVLGASRSILNDTPATLQSSGAGSVFELGIVDVQGQGILTDGESFTCTAFDNSTNLGSLMGSVQSETQNNTTYLIAGCGVQYPPNGQPMAPGTVLINLANGAINTGDTYTFVISH